MKNVNNLKDMNKDNVKPTFDCNGKPTGNKCILCIHQNKECPYQSFFGEGALLVCTYDLEKCFKEEIL